MELNADFDERVAVHAARTRWMPSPVPGVERRMLDRLGDEIARATTIVRFAPDSRFPAHVHGGGEEFLVLDGVFQDETGDFPAGSYIRNPPESRHTPASAAGCTLFVKLWQFDLADRTHVCIDTGKMPFLPAPGRGGVEILPLFRDAREDVRIKRREPRPGPSKPAPASGSSRDIWLCRRAGRLRSKIPLLLSALAMHFQGPSARNRSRCRGAGRHALSQPRKRSNRQNSSLLDARLCPNAHKRRQRAGPPRV